jgi:hypothetical protein
MAVTPAMWATGLVGVAWCVTGLAECGRRRANLIGPLMLLLGLEWFAAQLEHSGQAADAVRLNRSRRRDYRSAPQQAV